MNPLFPIVGCNHAVVYVLVPPCTQYKFSTLTTCSEVIILIDLAISLHGINNLTPATINPKLHSTCHGITYLKVLGAKEVMTIYFGIQVNVLRSNVISTLSYLFWVSCCLLTV